MNDIKKAIELLDHELRLTQDTIKNSNEGEGVTKFDFDYIDAVNIAIEALKKQLNGDWIPCKERMPENQPSWIGGTTYIIILKNKYNNIRTAFAKYKELKWIGDFGRIIPDNEILAWQPLPEKYEEVID